MRINFLNNEISNIHAAAFLLGAAGLFSRILGVLRDRLLAGHFGAGRELDIYYAAFQIPDFLSTVFLLGAGSAAILPIFQEHLSRSKKEAQNLISQLITIFLIVGALLALAVFFLAPFLVRIVTPGFSSSEQMLTVALTRIMLLSPILLGISSILSSVVQSFQRFLVFSLAPVLYNLGIIIGILFFVPIWGINGLGLGVITGAFLHSSLQLISVSGLGFRPSLVQISKISSGVREVVRLSFPRFVSISITRITILVLVALASTLAVGSISVFQLAQNLFYVPIGIFGVSYAVALFPRLSQAYLGRNGKYFFEELHIGIRTILFWTLPTAALFIVLRAHIVRVALGAGVFSWEDTRLSAAILAVLALAMFAEALSALLLKSYYALDNTKHPLVINVGTSLVSIILSFVFVKIIFSTSTLSEFITRWLRIGDIAHPEVLGLALGFSIGLILNILFLYLGLGRLAQRVFRIKEQFSFAPVIKMLLASIGTALAAYLVRVSFSQTLPLITFMQVLLQGVLASAAGFGVYFGVLWIAGSEDMLALLKACRRQLLRIKILPRSWDDGDTHAV